MLEQYMLPMSLRYSGSGQVVGQNLENLSQIQRISTLMKIETLDFSFSHPPVSPSWI